MGFVANASDPAPLRVPTLFACDAYGNAATAEVDNHNAYFNPIHYGGQYGYYKDYDGLYQLGHRYYDHTKGRFVTHDLSADKKKLPTFIQ